MWSDTMTNQLQPPDCGPLVFPLVWSKFGGPDSNLKMINFNYWNCNWETPDSWHDDVSWPFRDTGPFSSCLSCKNTQFILTVQCRDSSLFNDLGLSANSRLTWQQLASWMSSTLLCATLLGKNRPNVCVLSKDVNQSRLNSCFKATRLFEHFQAAFVN